MQLKFLKLQKDHVEYWNLVENFLIDQIQPLYGNLAGFIKKVREGIDRNTEILLYETRPVGVIIYKHQLCDEYASFGVEKAFELKTICLFEKNKKMAGLFLRLLLGRAAQQAETVRASCIVGTISSNKPEVLRVMRKIGFNVIGTFKERYVANVDEFLMCHQNFKNLIGNHCLNCCETAEKGRSLATHSKPCEG